MALLEAALESEELQQENRVEASEGQLPEDEAGLHQAPEVELKEEGNMAASEESDKEHIYEEPPEVGPVYKLILRQVRYGFSYMYPIFI